MPDLTPAQCRKARDLLRWSRDRLAARAGISIATLVGIEKEKAKPLPADLIALRTAFEEAGVEVNSEDGSVLSIRLRKARANAAR